MNFLTYDHPSAEYVAWLLSDDKAFFESTVKGKLATDRMFKTKDGRPWGQSLQSRRIRDACKKAEIEPAITYHILRHTYVSVW